MPSENISNLSKTVSTFENGYIPTNLHNLHDLIQKTESNLLLFLSEIGINDNSQVKREKIDQTDGIELDLISSKLVNINDSLNKASKWKSHLISEVKMEKESNESLRNEISLFCSRLHVIE